MAIGAYAVERDYSHYIANASRTILAVVSTASKGPIGEATVVTSSQDLVNKFGPLKTDCYGLYAAQYFLSQASKLYFVRAAGKSVAAAKANITGIDAESEEISNSIIFEMLEKGTYSNDYVLKVSAGTLEGDYNFILKNSAGLTVEEVKDISLSSITAETTFKNFKVFSIDLTIVSLLAGDYKFSGGSDGIEDIEADSYINASKVLSHDSVDANLLVTPGVSDVAVISHMLALAENRGDCFYLIDPPEGLDRDGVIKWVDGGDEYEHSMFNSSYGAVYYDWVRIYDSANKTYLNVPPSVTICASFAYSDRTSEVWYAPAGLTRGIIRGVINPVSSLSRADIDLLYEHHINAIYENPQVGNVIWGQKTLHRADTALNRVNVRRLLNYLKKVITAACQYLVFEPNDRVTWNSFEMKVMPILQSVKNRRGLYEYKIVRGETIVTADDIDNYRMPCMVLIRPTKAAEEIPIYFVITSTGADFNDVLDANGIVE